MPDDDEVIRVIKEYIGKAIVDLDTYGGKITEELIKEIKDVVDVLNKLLIATPIDKD
jgi:phage gp37-like protein